MRIHGYQVVLRPNLGEISTPMDLGISDAEVPQPVQITALRWPRMADGLA